MADIVKRFGWKPDSLDHRDHLYMMVPMPDYFKHLPPRADLRPLMPAVYSQGDLGSCTGNGIAACVQYQRMKQQLPMAASLDQLPSRLFIYWWERYMEGTVNEDSGAMIRDGIKVVSKRGVPFEPYWPYDVAKFRDQPSEEAEKMAARDMVVGYQRFPNDAPMLFLGYVRNCLSVLHDPVVFGCSVYSQFMDAGHGGVINMPGPGDAPIGGHCMVIVGYDDDQKHFIVRNSWGPEWGDHGHCYMPYSYLSSAMLADDFWRVSLVGAAGSD